VDPNNKLAIWVSEKCGFADTDLIPCAHIPFSLFRWRGGATPFKFFLGGSVPHLLVQDFSLIGIPFPALSKTYLSVSDLSSLQLLWIPSALLPRLVSTISSSPSLTSHWLPQARRALRDTSQCESHADSWIGRYRRWPRHAANFPLSSMIWSVSTSMRIICRR
jgi:hypothetical protein